MSVYFHANFNLNTERISNILSDLIERPELNDDQIANKYGYKSPFTKRYKSWMKKCGLIENATKIKLTKFGQVIYDKDFKINRIPSLWYMHSCLTSSEENAESWYFVYHSYLPKVENFTKPELSDAISMKLMPHDPGHFGRNAPMIKVITKVMIDSYISEKAFGTLGIVTQDNGTFKSEKLKNPLNWKDAESFSRLY